MDKLVETKNKGAHNLIYPFEVIPEAGKMLKIEDGVYPYSIIVHDFKTPLCS